MKQMIYWRENSSDSPSENPRSFQDSWVTRRMEAGDRILTRVLLYRCIGPIQNQRDRGVEGIREDGPTSLLESVPQSFSGTALRRL